MSYSNQNYFKIPKDQMHSKNWLNKADSDRDPDCHYSAPILQGISLQSFPFLLLFAEIPYVTLTNAGSQVLLFLSPYKGILPQSCWIKCNSSSSVARSF